MNPFRNLYVRLSTPFKDEENNKQTKLTRTRFLELFMQVAESNPEMNFCALNFFTLQELNVVKIIFKKTNFEKWDGTGHVSFLSYFTDQHFLRDRIYNNDGHVKYSHPQIMFFIEKLKRRGTKVRISNVGFRNQFKKILNGVIRKLQALNKLKRRTRDPNRLIRHYLRSTGLRQYFKWAIRVGRRFTNRKEKDFSNWYVRSLIQENLIIQEKCKTRLQEKK